MSRRDDSRRTLSAEKDALGVYLESLLQVREDDEEAPTPPLESAPEPAQAVAEARQVPEPAPQPTPEPVSEPRAEPAAEAPTMPVVEPAPAPAPETETPNLPAVIPAASEPDPWEGVPEWGEEPFQALLFELSGLTMAIPLAELAGVLEWPENITHPESLSLTRTNIKIPGTAFCPLSMRWLFDPSKLGQTFRK